MNKTARQPQISDYDYLEHMSTEGWAWEFVRRNPDYRKAWQSRSSASVAVAPHDNMTDRDEKEGRKPTQFGLLFLREP